MRADARRRVEPDREARAAAAGGIIGEDSASRRSARRRAAQSDPGAGPDRRRARCRPDRGSGRRPVKPSAGSRRVSSLKAMGPMAMRPSNSGSTTCIVISAAERPRGGGKPGLARRTRGIDLQDRTIGRIENESAIVTRRKGRGRDDRCRAARSAIASPQRAFASVVLQARGRQGRASCHARARQGRARSASMACVSAGEDGRAVDDEIGRRRVGGERRAGCVRSCAGRARRPTRRRAAPARRRGRNDTASPISLRDATQERLHVLDAAGAEIGVEFRTESVRHGGEGAKGAGPAGRRPAAPRADAGVSADCRAGARGRSASNPGRRGSARARSVRARDGLLGIKIDRKRMAQLLQAGEAKRSAAPRVRADSAAAKRAQVAVGERQAPRYLPAPDRDRSALFALVERDRGDREKVHRQPAECGFDRCAVETLEADHHEPALARPRRSSRGGRNDARCAGRRPARRGARAGPRPARNP